MTKERVMTDLFRAGGRRAGLIAYCFIVRGVEWNNDSSIDRFCTVLQKEGIPPVGS